MPFKIIVVGAGASGLMAARLLAEEKYSVAVIEARDRPGGRIHTIDSRFSLPIEAGAEFIHGSQPLTQSLVEEAKGSLSHLSGNWYQYWDGAVREHNFFDKDWQFFTTQLGKLKMDTSIAGFLREHFSGEKYAGLRQKVTGFVQGYDAADVQEVSALALKEEWSQTDEEHQYRIKGGYRLLVRHLEKKVKESGGIIMNASPVTEIQWRPGNAKVVTDSGKVIEGEKVIITVPIGILQTDAIRFFPPLPDHRKAFNEIGYGGVIKFFFEFRSRFWQEGRGQKMKNAAFIISDADIPTWWSQLPDKTPLLTGWFGGPPTFQANRDTEVLFHRAIGSLAYIFGRSSGEIKDELKEWYIADWVKDPFALGAYAYPKVQTKKAREFLTRAVNETLYFAGEGLYKGPAMGTVEAALVSGKEVAAKV